MFISYGKKSKYEKDELYNVDRYADVRRRHFLATIPYSIYVGMLAGYVLLINEKVNVARVIDLFLLRKIFVHNRHSACIVHMYLVRCACCFTFMLVPLLFLKVNNASDTINVNRM